MIGHNPSNRSSILEQNESGILIVRSIDVLSKIASRLCHADRNDFHENQII